MCGHLKFKYLVLIIPNHGWNIRVTPSLIIVKEVGEDLSDDNSSFVPPRIRKLTNGCFSDVRLKGHRPFCHAKLYSLFLRSLPSLPVEITWHSTSSSVLTVLSFSYSLLVLGPNLRHRASFRFKLLLQRCTANLHYHASSSSIGVTCA